MSDKVLVTTCPRCGETTGAALVEFASNRFTRDLVNAAVKRGDSISTVDGPVSIGGGCKCKRKKDKTLFDSESP